jgi:hypothetical protein
MFLKNILLAIVFLMLLISCIPNYENDDLLSIPVESERLISTKDLQYYREEFRKYKNEKNLIVLLSKIWGGSYVDANNMMVSVKKSLINNDILYDAILIFDSVPDDDSVSGYRYNIRLKENDDSFDIVYVKESGRCWNDRGHRLFSVEPCM